MIDFTSSLYLGLRHPSRSLAPWAALSLGAPAALREPPGAAGAARRVAELMGCSRGVLAPSTLHVFWDLFRLPVLASAALYLEAGCYPIARWGAENAKSRGIPVRVFPRRDPSGLVKAMELEEGRLPVVVADGLEPLSGRPAPLPRYLELVSRRSGLLVVDDSQALGILGVPSTGSPYGSGGGGSLRRHSIGGPEVVVAASLAKAFGVPVAVLAGGAGFVEHFEKYARTRTHCSPPSAAAIQAALRALDINRERGDHLRLTLAGRVARFKRRLGEAGIDPGEGLFPVRTIPSGAGIDALALYGRLREMGVLGVPTRGREAEGPRLTFLLTASHTDREIDEAGALIGRALGSAFRPGGLPRKPRERGMPW